MKRLPPVLLLWERDGSGTRVVVNRYPPNMTRVLVNCYSASGPQCQFARNWLLRRKAKVCRPVAELCRVYDL